MEGPILALVCVAMFLIGYGLLMIFAKDLMWELQVWSNKARGELSERTDVWDTNQTIGGVMMIVFGGMAIFLLFAAFGNDFQRQADEQARATGDASTAVALGSNLSALFADEIALWQADESRGVKRVTWSEPNAGSAQVYYGRCRDSFYMVLMNYSSAQLGVNMQTDFAYVPDALPQNCHPTGMTVNATGIWPYYRVSLGNDWYQVEAFGTENEIITRTPRPTSTPRPTATITPTADAAQLQATLDSAVATQVAEQAQDDNLPVTQTIQAAVEATLNTLRSTPTPTPG
jgi:hypothetical protein